MQKIINKKIISYLIIISIFIPSLFFFSIPQKSSAQQVDPVVAGTTGAVIGTGATTAATTGTGAVAQVSGLGIATNTWYGKLLDQVLMAVARKVLGEITKSTVNWINGGFHGSPLFIENPGSFFNDIAKSELKRYVDMIGYDSLKYPFGKNFALGIINSYKNTLQKNAAYTLSNAIRDPNVLSNYRNNFNYGGWNAFLINTQYPQNNYLGFQMTMAEQLSREVQGTAQTAVQQVKDVVAQGAGFLSPKTCPTNASYNNMVNEFQKPDFNEAEYTRKNKFPESKPGEDYGVAVKAWDDAHDAARAAWEKDNTCPGGLKSTTPGSVVSNQITTALGSNFRQTELGAAMGNSLSSIFDALLNKFIGTGLSSLTSAINTKPTPDNWTYDGQSLGANEGQDWASGTDVVVDLRKFRMDIEGKTVRTFKREEKLLNENGAIKKYGEKEPIICIGGEIIEVDSNNNTIKACVRGEILTNANGVQQYHTAGGEILAEGGEVVTWIGDTAQTTGGEYFPGDMQNTITELSLMDNPCDPEKADDCKYIPMVNPKKPLGLWTGSTQDFKMDKTYIEKYKPGIIQLIAPIMDATQVLDWCIPGPDKDWEKRLDSEYELQDRKLQKEAGLTDGDTAKAAKAMQKDLKFAVTAFKDWIDNKMISILPGTMFYLDAVKDVDNTAQQLIDLKASKKMKGQAIARLGVISNGLQSLAEVLANNIKPDGTKAPLTQPETGTSQEKVLIKYKQQYDAIKSSVSSPSTVEDTKKQIEIMKDKLFNLTGDPTVMPAKTGLITECTDQRKQKWNIEVDEEQTVFCEVPIRSGYSHGTVIRDSDANRKENNGETSKPLGTDMSNWFVFRNGEDNGVNDDGDVLSHPYGSFKDLPMVNAKNIEGDGAGSDLISIQMNCGPIMNARNTDYTHGGEFTQ